MVMQTFGDFWSSEKSLTEDIFFHRSIGHSDVFVFDELGFVGEACEEMYVTGDFNCRTGSMAFNFMLKGVGAVRRFCLGGPEHNDTGRFHEHMMGRDVDALPVNNLPLAISRNDLQGLDPIVVGQNLQRS